MRDINATGETQMTATETATPTTKTRKASKPILDERWIEGPGREARICRISLVQADYYEIREVGSAIEDTRAFQVTKVMEASGGETYDVLLGVSPTDHACTCKGHQFGNGRPCKHVKALRRLLSESEPTTTIKPVSSEPAPC